MNASLDLLAQVPSSYVYIDPFKLAAFVVVFAIWAWFAQWVDKDTQVVNTYRILWNLIVLGSGAGAMLLGLLLPIFVVGFLLFLVIGLAVIVVYVVHRNRLVKPEDTVCTMAHFRRLKEEGFSGKKRVIEVKERVRLTGADGRVVPIPEEDEEREQYRLIQDLFFDALWRRAATAVVVPAGQQAAKVTYVIDGIATEREGLPREDADAIVLFLKRIAGLNLEELRKPQHGEIMAAIGENKYKVLVRTDGSTAGEKLTIRIIYGEARFKVPDLGFNPKQLEIVQATKEVSKGLILLSAPPTMGLTTTIYSFTRNHDRFLQNVQTVEFQKEMDLDNVTQNVFVPGGNQTFAERLLKLVRSDPDIIVLPEVRDRESAAIVSKAAAEKQKVYVALQAMDVFDALRKWIAAVADKSLVAKSLLAVSNQRLVRVLCSECKQEYKPDAQMMRKLNLPPDKTLYRPPEPMYDKKGNPIICQACQGSGYAGRTGVFDWLSVDDGLRLVIRRSDSMSDVQNYALKKGGLGIQSQALQKVLAGVTSVQEVARAVRGPGGAPPPRSRPGAAGKPKPKPRSDGGGKEANGGNG